jgi:hypothetical protein
MRRSFATFAVKGFLLFLVPHRGRVKITGITFGDPFGRALQGQSKPASREFNLGITFGDPFGRALQGQSKPASREFNLGITFGDPFGRALQGQSKPASRVLLFSV